MASTKIAFMPQDSIPPYFPEQNIRPSGLGSQSGRNGLWSSAPPATPQTSTTSTGSVWGSPLSVLPPLASAHSSHGAPFALNTMSTSSGPSPELGHSSLAALAADSEPILNAEDSTSSGLLAQRTQSSSNSTINSRHNSQSDILPHSPGGTSVGLGYNSGSNTASPSPSMSSSILAVNNEHKQSKQSVPHTQSQHNVPNDEIINTAIVVKNIPFAIKKEQLIDFMVQLGVPLPYAFNYHFDNGVFRGLAFANFASSEETAQVITTLNGKELGGRKLRVEYKKMLPFQERERIEREKRERRGQLEEQHQQKNGSAANAANYTMATPQNSQSQQSSTKRANSRSPVQSAPQSPQILHHGAAVPLSVGTPAATPLATPTSSFGSGLPTPSQPLTPVPVDMNNPENLQMYTTLLLFKRDSTKLELIIPPSSSSSLDVNQIHSLNLLCPYLDLQFQGSDETGLVISKRPVSASPLLKNEMEPDYCNAGIFRNAIITPAAHPLSRVSLSGIPSAQTSSINPLNPLNRWSNSSPVNYVAK